MDEKEKIKRRQCFKLVTPGRTFIIDAETEDEQKSWIIEIRKVLEKPKSK